MATVLDVVTAALREIGVLAGGETATSDDATDGMAALNRLIDQWAAERLQIYTLSRTTWTIVSGTGAYTVGTGGTVNVARPVFLDHVNFNDTSPSPDQEYPLERLTDDEWAILAQKALTSALPGSWHYEPTYPLGTLNLWPVPTSSTLQGVLYAPAAISQFASLATSVALPPGYERMLVKNLGVELCPSYGRQADQLLVRQAIDATATIKRANRRLREMMIDPSALCGSGSAYNIETDS